MKGVDLYVVKELLGHSSIEMTERYAHLAPSAGKEAVARLECRSALPMPLGSQVASNGIYFI